FAQGGPLGEDDLAGRLQALTHRGLLPALVVPHTFNRLAVLTAPTPDTLASRLEECRGQRLPGVPRRELLRHPLDAAQALDEVHREYRVQHLGLNPRNLVLAGGQLLIADFGLVALLWLPAGQEVGALNARYSPPELLGRGPAPALVHCDQYSLALIYHELL